jgi:hypothetical protein
MPQQDIFTTGQALPDQVPNGAVAIFSFSGNPVNLIWVKPVGGNCRVDPFGGIPDATTGIPCDDGLPNPITVLTDTVRIYAGSGVVVSVWGFRY